MSVIVHTILLDKFTSSAIQSWPDPENHTWIGIGDRNSPCDYQFQRPLDPKTIEDIITQHKVWVMHRYIPELSGLISTSKTSKIPVIIQTWGPDYLQYNLFTKHLLPRTRKFIQRNTTQSQRIKAVRNEIYWHIKRVKQRQGFKDAHAILFGTPEERINFTSKYSHGGNKRLFYNHEAPKKPININPRMLILGHCSDPSMNHLDALHHLKNQDYQIQRILIPLSYGHGPIEYKKFIIKQANHLFGKR